MDFEFGETQESGGFFTRRPKFYAVFERLVRLSNLSFGPRHVSSRFIDVCHRLGITCRNDFLEMVFLAVNGHGIGATKLLRGMYERAVTLGYLLKHPDKADRFVEYAAINEYRIVEQARKLFSDAEIDAALHENSVATIKQNYEKYKGPFLRNGGKKPAPSWDIDFASQVRDVGSPFLEYYLSAYLFPTSHVHATLTSIMQPHERQLPEVQADLSLMMAHILFAKVIELHSQLFNLCIKQDLEQCEADFCAVWWPNLNSGIAPADGA